eukprot:gene18259-biopygen3924
MGTKSDLRILPMLAARFSVFESSGSDLPALKNAGASPRPPNGGVVVARAETASFLGPFCKLLASSPAHCHRRWTTRTAVITRHARVRTPLPEGGDDCRRRLFFGPPQE